MEQTGSLLTGHDVFNFSLIKWLKCVLEINKGRRLEKQAADAVLLAKCQRG